MWGMFGKQNSQLVKCDLCKQQGKVKYGHLPGTKCPSQQTASPTVKGIELPQRSTRALQGENPVLSRGSGEQSISSVYDRYAGVTSSAHPKGAEVRGGSVVDDTTTIDGSPRVYNSQILDYAKVGPDVEMFSGAVVRGNSEVRGQVRMSGSVEVSDNAHVEGVVTIMDKATVNENAHVEGEVLLANWSSVSGSAQVTGKTSLYDNARVTDNAQVGGRSILREDCIIFDNANVNGVRSRGKTWIFGNATVQNVTLRNGGYIGGEAFITKQDHVEVWQETPKTTWTVYRVRGGGVEIRKNDVIWSETSSAPVEVKNMVYWVSQPSEQ